MTDLIIVLVLLFIAVGIIQFTLGKKKYQNQMEVASVVHGYVQDHFNITSDEYQLEPQMKMYYKTWEFILIYDEKTYVVKAQKKQKRRFQL